MLIASTTGIATLFHVSGYMFLRFLIVFSPGFDDEYYFWPKFEFERCCAFDLVLDCALCYSSSGVFLPPLLSLSYDGVYLAGEF